jgi:methylthioribose-1-phosphate isomerase
MVDYFSIKWVDGRVRMLDQRLLPQRIEYLDFTDYHEVAWAIREMVIRGAPAIGAAAGYGLALAAENSNSGNLADAVRELKEAATILLDARPTAVNLSYAVERVMQRVTASPFTDFAGFRRLVFNEATAIAEENVRMNESIGRNALPFVPEKASILHHCNTGALATVAYGTALGIIRAAHEHGKKVFVYVDETRPRLQGARLTAWELQQLDIPHAVIVDGAAAYIMKEKGVDLVTVGCDRVAANGDTANKIGTYNLAIVARAHGVPFYVAAPTSTIDLSIQSGSKIPVEQRLSIEVSNIGAECIVPEGTQVLNPAFDVTPAEYITAIVTEQGVAYPPYSVSLPSMVAAAEAKRKVITSE